jgi:hypothetical protein
MATVERNCLVRIQPVGAMMFRAVVKSAILLHSLKDLQGFTWASGH